MRRAPGINTGSSRDAERALRSDRLQDTQARPGQPALHKFNCLFHDLYAARGEDVWRRLEAGETPVVVRMDDRLVLQADGGAMEYEITGERYHELKAASHIPAAVYLALTDPDASSDRAGALADGLDDLRDLGEGTDAIVTVTRRLLAHVRSSDRNADLREELAGYRSAAGRALQMLAREAAGMEIEALDRAMLDIEARLGPKRLSKTYFVICAGHQPRYKQLSKLYFRHWLGDAGWPDSRIEHHVVYAEGKDSLQEALKLVRSRIVDGQLSAALFEDLVSLDEDVLGDAGLEQLARRFGS